MFFLQMHLEAVWILNEFSMQTVKEFLSHFMNKFVKEESEWRKQLIHYAQ